MSDVSDETVVEEQVDPVPVAPPTPQEAPPEPAAAPAAAPAEAPPQEEAPIEEKPMTISATPPPDLTPEQAADKRLADQISFAGDLSSGKIKPETYHSLFEKKDTLGKVGTIFGLLLSGAGSGLTHQPNALLEMMNKQIQNDVEAQKENQGNKRNWYALALQHEKQRPEIMQKYAEAELSHQKALYEKWLNASNGVDETAASNGAFNYGSAAMLQYQQDMINRMPPGEKRDAAQYQQDNVVIPYFLDQAKKRALETEHKRAAVNALNPIPVAKNNPPPKGEAKPGEHYDAFNQNKLNAMIQKGRFAPNVPGAIPPERVSSINQEITELTTNRKNLADADAAFKALANMKNAGEMPISGAVGAVGTGAATLAGLLSGGPVGGAIGAGISKMASPKAGESIQNYFERNRKIQVDALKQRIGGPNISRDEKDALVESMLPKWNDTPESMEEAHKQMVQHFKDQPAEAAPLLTQYGLKYEAPKYGFKYKKPKETTRKETEYSKPKETITRPSSVRGQE